MTLIELLVVVTILAILLGAAIPVIAPANDSRRLREAARSVNAFIAGAKARASETGRPFGVALKKLSRDTARIDPTTDANDNGVCLELYYVEEAPPYAGFDSQARVRLSLDSSNSAGGMRIQFVRYDTFNVEPESSVPLPAGLDFDPIPSGVFREGDAIEVAGRLFYFTDTTTSRDTAGYYVSRMPGDPEELFVRPASMVVPSTIARGAQEASLYYSWPDQSSRGLPNGLRRFEGLTWTEPLRYKIYRQPTRASGDPLQLPEKTAIDLEASGFGSGLRLHDPFQTDGGGSPAPNNNPSDVIVMFSPEGAMREAYVNTGPPQAGAQRYLLSSNLFLLVGLRENIPAPQTDFASFTGTDREKQELKQAINWLNGDSRWVVVGAQTGTVTSVENAFVEPQEYVGATSVSLRRSAEVNAAREFARQMIQQGGR